MNDELLYGFDTDDKEEATAALIVYVCWMSRDTQRFKITPKVWDQVAGFIRSASKRSRTIPDFIGRFAPMVKAGSLNPKWMKVGIAGALPPIKTDTGELIEIVVDDDDRRAFITDVIRNVDQRSVIRKLNENSEFIVMLVRERREREIPVEKRFGDAFARAFEPGEVIDMEVPF